MSQEQQQDTPEDEGSSTSASGQHRQQPLQSEGHGGQGSESIMKELREWEDRRAGNSGGKRRPGSH